MEGFGVSAMRAVLTLLLIVCRPIGCTTGTVRSVKRDITAKKVGEAIRRFREAEGFSQEGLAERCGLHRTYVGSVERGERNVSLANIVRIARALGKPPSALLEGL